MSCDSEHVYMHNKNNPDGCNASREAWKSLPLPSLVTFDVRGACELRGSMCTRSETFHLNMDLHLNMTNI